MLYSARSRGSLAWLRPHRRAVESVGGINHQDGRSPAAEFQDEVEVRYPSGYDPDGAVARNFGVVGLPTTVLVDASGQMVGRRLREVSEEELLALVGAFRSDPGGGYS